jgi:hypothetical protein
VDSAILVGRLAHPDGPNGTEDERGSLKGQIEQLKTFLEHAQVERKRKIEYDSFAEKINTLPCRAELEQCDFKFIGATLSS